VAGLFDERDGGLITYWKTISAITDLVGAGTAARIYPLIGKERTDRQDRIIYERTDGESIQHLAGTSGVRQSILYCYCYSDTLSGADAIAEALRANTANYRGTLSGVYVYWIECTDALDDGIDEAKDKSDTHRYWVRVIFRITHAEAVGV